MLLRFLLPLALALCVAVNADSVDWLKKANAALISADYANALEAFSEAIAADPPAYLTYFRRATAQQALGRTGAALADLESTVERNPKFGKAYLQRARLELREGEYRSALETLKRMNKHVQDAKDKAAAEDLRTQIAHAKGLETRLGKLCPRKVDECIQTADELLKLAPNDVSARRRRADAEMARGNLDAAVIDWTRLAHLAPSPELQLRLSLVAYYVLGTRESQMQDAGFAHIKACLHNDPDNKRCSRAFKQMRKVDKAMHKARGFSDSNSWAAVVSALKGAKVGAPIVYDEVAALLRDAAQGEDAVLPPGVDAKSELLHEIEGLYCKAYVEQNLVRKAMPWCEKLLARDPNNVQALVAKGEEHMSAGKYEEAVRVFAQAFEQTENSDRGVHQRLAKAQKLMKQSKAKDYYKTLGIARDADERTIKKAYRQLAREHHPDKGGSQEKMAEINEAFGVLSDPELRARYDQGDDPNDPTGGQDAYEHPFAQGNPFARGEHPFAQFFQQAHFQNGGPFQGEQFHFSF